MNRYAFPLLALLATLAPAPGWAAAARRAPQAPIAGNGLQDYFDSIGESIDVRTDQLARQRWPSCGDDDDDPAVLQIELVRHSGAYAVGIYDSAEGGSPQLCEIFAAGDGGNRRAVALLEPARRSITLDLFDTQGAWRSIRTFSAIYSRLHGYYLSGQAGVVYSQDHRQPGSGAVRMLAFAGTGSNTGGFWLCFENADPGDPDPDDDFDDTILFLGSVNPTPTARSSWGSVKALFR